MFGMKPNWFVAFPLRAETWLSQVLAGLPRECRGFHDRDIHLTYAFLGAMSPDRKQGVLELMNRIECEPFPIRLGLMRALPNPKRVSALSFEVAQGRDRVHALIAGLRGPLIEVVGARPDPRPPLAHITVARPNRKYGVAGRNAALAWARQVLPPGDSLIIDRVALYTWSEDRSLRQFRIVAEKSLSGR